MPDEKSGPAPRITTHAHGRVVGRGAQRGAGGQHQLVVERVALLRPVEDDVADGAVIF